MNIETIKTFTAQLTLGRHIGYTTKKNSIERIKKILKDSQEIIKNKSGILLSAKLIRCEIVFLGQEEPSVEINFIQYPKFPVKEEVLIDSIILLAKYMMEELEQNRTVVVFQDETVMLEKTSSIDPTINFNASA